MADKKDQAITRTGPFRLGRKFDEVGPDLGHLYESWHVPTGQPAVTLRPGDRMHWLHGGPWELVISCEHDSPDVSMRLRKAPPFAPPTQMMDLLVLVNAAFRRVEDSPRLHAHFAYGPVRTRWRGWLPRAAVGATVLLLGIGLWFHVTAGAPGPARPCPAGNFSLDAPSLINAGAPIAYPIPKQPFRNQAKAPCKTQNKLEVEINGGCWVALEQKPPCAEDRAEHEGKCYLPVSKDRGHPPQVVEP